MEEFESWVHDIDPDIIGVTESWATSSVLDSELALSDYDLFRCDRPVARDGGGVLLYVKSDLHAAKCSLSSNFPEQVWCYFLDARKVKCYVGVCYRTPTLDIYGSLNHDLLHDVINELGYSKKHFMLMGDFNYRYTCWPPGTDSSTVSREAVEFSECLEDNFLTQHVDVCTRNKAILDLVITDEPDMVHDVASLGLFPGSDHNALLWKLCVKTTRETSHQQMFDYSKADVVAMKHELQAINWQERFSMMTAEECWIDFKDLIDTLKWKYIPVKCRLNKRNKPIWMTNRALKAVRHRRQVYRKYKDNKHPACIKASRAACSTVKAARQNFENQLARKIKEDRKSFFAYARSKSKTNVKVGPLVGSRGEVISNATEEVTVLNDFFCSVFTKEDISSIPTPDSCNEPRTTDRLEDIIVKPETIAAKLEKLRADKAAGDDNLSPRLLKTLSTEIAVPVSMIFRKSLDTGCVPADWRTANVTPIYKKGKRCQPENYRPVSLTSQICKVVESVLRDELVSHLDRNKLITSTQHGFRKGLSCASNLLAFLENVTACVDDKQNVDTIYLDLAKAFDKVPHQRLLLKLKTHGVDGLVCKWIKAWLSDRQQRVCVDGCYSSWRQVWSGVPQGSVLGPVLFLIFINDLDNGLTSSVLKFADDTKLFRPVTNQSDGQILQNDLDTVCSWAKRWQMEFNVAKCKVMHFGKSNIGCKYSMDKQPVDVVDSEKDLGVIVSSDLKAEANCKEAYTKANKMLGLISRTIKYRNPTILINLYKSLVRPHLDYCSAVWSPHYIKDKSLLEKVQHRFTRLFHHLRKLSYEERLGHLGLWTLEERRNRADLIEVFKMIKGLSATPWSSFFQTAAESSTRGHSWKFAKKSCRSDTRLYFFSQRVVNRWNSLSQLEVDAPSINSFKHHLEKRRIRQMDFFKD